MEFGEKNADEGMTKDLGVVVSKVRKSRIAFEWAIDSICKRMASRFVNSLGPYQPPSMAM